MTGAGPFRGGVCVSMRVCACSVVEKCEIVIGDVLMWLEMVFRLTSDICTLYQNLFR